MYFLVINHLNSMIFTSAHSVTVGYNVDHASADRAYQEQQNIEKCYSKIGSSVELVTIIRIKC